MPRDVFSPNVILPTDYGIDGKMLSGTCNLVICLLPDMM